MILPDHNILGIEPFEAANVQPSSLDVQLGDALSEMNTELFDYIDPLNVPPNLMRPHNSPWPRPGQFVLGCTHETVRMPHHVAGQFEGKSSLARLGLIVHVTAGYIDPGFCGQITLEMTNVGDLPIKLTPGMLIGQIVFHRMTE